MLCGKCGNPMDAPVLAPPGTTANICKVCNLPIEENGKPVCADCTFPAHRCNSCGVSVHAHCLGKHSYWGQVCPDCDKSAAITPSPGDVAHDAVYVDGA
jgi:hypothetical protein